MDLSNLVNSHFFTWVILPLLIVLARICDVTLGTIRIMFLARGRKWFVPLLGFFEILIWLLAIRQIMQNLSNVICYIAYAGGFALGNLIGMSVEERLAFGKVVVRIITAKDGSNLVLSLSRKGFGVTNVPARGSKRDVSVIFTIVDRSDLDQVIQMVERFNPKAFYTIEDIRAAKKGVFRRKKSFLSRLFFKKSKVIHRFRIYQRYMRIRKGK